MPRRSVIGIVKSDKAAKTRVVVIPRLVKHEQYGKFVRRRTVCYVHDEANASAEGDKVEIIESRPRSRTKRWELVKIVERRRKSDVQVPVEDSVPASGSAPADQPVAGG